MIRLFHCPGARSLRTLWLLRELALEHEIVEIPFHPKLLAANPELVKVSPLARVPALVDGSTKLFESGAICQYLCESYDAAARLWRRPGDPERAEWLQWLHFAETVAAHGSNLIQQKVIIAEPDRSPTVVKLETRRLEKALGVLEQQLGARDYLLASGFTAVDVGMAFSVMLAHSMTSFETFPRLEAYRKRIFSRPAFSAKAS